MHDTTAGDAGDFRANTPTIRAFSSCTGAFRPSPICAGSAPAGCRTSPSNMRRRRGRRHRHRAQLDARSTRSRWCRATASYRRCRRSTSSCSASVTPRRSASRRWAARRGVARRRQYLAAAAQRARVPYTLGCVGGVTVEGRRDRARRVLVPALSLLRATTTPSASIWSSAPTPPACHVLMLTLDVPVRTIRAARGGGRHRPRRSEPDLRMIAGMLKSPGYVRSLMAQQRPAALCQHLSPTPGRTPSVNETPHSRASEMGGAFTWDEVARYRDELEAAAGGQGHPASGRRREGGGARGRRHPGLEPWRPPDRSAAGADRRAAGDRARGRQQGDNAVRFAACAAGTDVVRALALGADAALAGKAFLWGLGALGAEGPGHVIDLFDRRIAVGARPDRRAFAGARRGSW